MPAHVPALARVWARRAEPQRDVDFVSWVARAGAGTRLQEVRSALLQEARRGAGLLAPARLAVARLVALRVQAAAVPGLVQALCLLEAEALPAGAVEARRPFARERRKAKTLPKARARTTPRNATEACPSN